MRSSIFGCSCGVTTEIAALANNPTIPVAASVAASAATRSKLGPGGQSGQVVLLAHGTG